jgi:hypothetical protein
VLQGLTPPRSATVLDVWVEAGGFFATKLAARLGGLASAGAAQAQSSHATLQTRSGALDRTFRGETMAR